MNRKASAVWQGGLKKGNGVMSTESGILADANYSFTTRFEGAKGTNPEELIAAAHAGCFSMALAAQLENAGIIPERISTAATVTMERLEPGWTVTESHLEVTVRAPKADRAVFDSAAASAKSGCPISRLLNAKVTMTATLEA